MILYSSTHKISRVKSTLPFFIIFWIFSVTWNCPFPWAIFLCVQLAESEAYWLIMDADKERFSWLFFSFEIFMYLYSVFYSMCSKYSLDFTYLEAKFICRFQGSRPIMTMPKRGWVLQRKWVWSPPTPHRYANFYSNHVRLHDYYSWWRLDTPMGSNIICITFNFICQITWLVYLLFYMFPPTNF